MEIITTKEIMCDNKVVICFWEESSKNGDITLDGCSLHLTDSDRLEYIEEIYSNRTDQIPDTYDRIVGDNGYDGYITDDIYNKLLEEKSIRLSQVEFSNLMKMEEVIVEYL